MPKLDQYSEEEEFHSPLDGDVWAHEKSAAAIITSKQAAANADAVEASGGVPVDATHKNPIPATSPSTSDTTHNSNNSNNNNRNHTTGSGSNGYRQPCYGGYAGNGSSFHLDAETYAKKLAKEQKYEKIGQKILDMADIKINGSRPADMRILNPAALQRVIQKGSLGLGEAFMEGWWDSADFHSLHIFFEKVLRGGIEYYFPNNAMDMVNILKAKLINPQTKKKSKRVGLMHYDMGNEFFEKMLGHYMQYSCGYWIKHKHESQLTEEDRRAIEAQRETNETYDPEVDGFVYGCNDESFLPPPPPTTAAATKNDEDGKEGAEEEKPAVLSGMVAVPITDLEEAQRTKLAMIAEKLRLRPGMEVLDVGCGWGGLALFLAEHYDVRVVGITISEEQKKNAEAMTAAYRDKITVLVTDYRDLQAYYEKEKGEKNKKFDRIVSVGMFEHVGPQNYEKYFEVMRSLLNEKDPEAVMVLHTIGSLQSKDSADQWYLKYIFPGGCLPSMTNMGKCLGKVFVVEDMHNFGYFYYLTLMAWRERFLAYWASHQSMPANVKRKLVETAKSKKAKAKAAKHNTSSDNLPSNNDQQNGPAKDEAAAQQEQDDRETFFRMFYYYLSSSAGAFKSRDLQLWQFVLSPAGVRGYPDVHRP